MVHSYPRRALTLGISLVAVIAAAAFGAGPALAAGGTVTATVSASQPTTIPVSMSSALANPDSSIRMADRR